MKEINLLIVDDNKRTRKLIKQAINRFNSLEQNFEVSLSGEADSVDEAIVIINKPSTDPIQLVFLDYNLKGTKKGFEISRKYPDLAYIVISHQIGIMEMINYEKQQCHYPYMEHITSGGNYNTDDIFAAIRKFLQTIIAD